MGVLAIPSIINSYEYEVEYRMKRKILFLYGYLYVYTVCCSHFMVMHAFAQCSAPLINE